MLTLYQRTDCPFCWKVRIALEELSLDYEIVPLRLGDKHPDVVKLSPTGTVPVFVAGQAVVWESSVILDYLDRRFAPGRLIPAEPDAEARVRLLQAYSDKVVGGCMKDLVFEKRSKPESEWDADLIRAAEAKWHACQAWLEAQLGRNALFGKGFSAADCALAARFGVAAAYGAAVTEEYPALHSWFAAVRARPAWRSAYPTSFIRADKAA